MLAAEPDGALGALHALPHVLKLREMLLIARFPLLHLALGFGQALRGLLGLRQAVAELPGLRLPALDLFAGFAELLLEVGRSLFGFLRAVGEIPDLACRRQSDQGEEGSYHAHDPAPTFYYMVAERSGYDGSAVSTEELLRRLREVTAALGSPVTPVVSQATEGDTPVDGAEVQATSTAYADTLLARIASVTATLKGREGSWDAVDQLTAQLLLSDLASIAGTWRSLGTMAGERLEKALAELQAAGREAERILKDSTPQA